MKAELPAAVEALFAKASAGAPRFTAEQITKLSVLFKQARPGRRAPAAKPGRAA